MSLLGTKRKRGGAPYSVRTAPAAEVVRCICSTSADDGQEMIECDGCKVWQHTDCVGARAGQAAWRCERCDPRSPAQLAAMVAQARARRGMDVGPSDEYIALPRDDLHALTSSTLDALRPALVLEHEQMLPPPGYAAEPRRLNLPRVHYGAQYGFFARVRRERGDLLARFLAVVTRAPDYLGEPANMYPSLLLPKPYVHLLPAAPVPLALDTRRAGSTARFARSGCWPNAELLPARVGGQLAFVLAATRDIAPGDEIVLPWEWDDMHPVHRFARANLQSSGTSNLRAHVASFLSSAEGFIPPCACVEPNACLWAAMHRFVAGEPVPPLPAALPLVKRGISAVAREGFGQGAKLLPSTTPPPTTMWHPVPTPPPGYAQSKIKPEADEEYLPHRLRKVQIRRIFDELRGPGAFERGRVWDPIFTVTIRGRATPPKIGKARGKMDVLSLLADGSASASGHSSDVPITPLAALSLDGLPDPNPAPAPPPPPPPPPTRPLSPAFPERPLSPAFPDPRPPLPPPTTQDPPPAQEHPPAEQEQMDVDQPPPAAPPPPPQPARRTTFTAWLQQRKTTTARGSSEAAQSPVAEAQSPSAIAAAGDAQSPAPFAVGRFEPQTDGGGELQQDGRGELQTDGYVHFEPATSAAQGGGAGERGGTGEPQIDPALTALDAERGVSEQLHAPPHGQAQDAVSSIIEDAIATAAVPEDEQQQLATPRQPEAQLHSASPGQLRLLDGTPGQQQQHHGTPGQQQRQVLDGQQLPLPPNGEDHAMASASPADGDAPPPATRSPQSDTTAPPPQTPEEEGEVVRVKSEEGWGGVPFAAKEPGEVVVVPTKRARSPSSSGSSRGLHKARRSMSGAGASPTAHRFGRRPDGERYVPQEELMRQRFAEPHPHPHQHHGRHNHQQRRASAGLAERRASFGPRDVPLPQHVIPPFAPGREFGPGPGPSPTRDKFAQGPPPPQRDFGRRDEREFGGRPPPPPDFGHRGSPPPDFRQQPPPHEFGSRGPPPDFGHGQRAGPPPQEFGGRPPPPDRGHGWPATEWGPPSGGSGWDEPPRDRGWGPPGGGGWAPPPDAPYEYDRAPGPPPEQRGWGDYPPPRRPQQQQWGPPPGSGAGAPSAPRAMRGYP